MPILLKYVHKQNPNSAKSNTMISSRFMRMLKNNPVFIKPLHHKPKANPKRVTLRAGNRFRME